MRGAVMRRTVMRGAVMRRMAAGGAAVATVAVLLLTGTTAAHAHDVLVATDPADGSTVTTVPDAVTLTFSAPALALGTQVVVRTPDGRDVADGDVVIVAATVTQTIADVPLPAGTYVVEWRVTSSDGHTIDGTFSFDAREAAGPTPTPSATPEPSASPAPTSTASAGTTASASATARPTIDPGPRGGGPAAFVVGGVLLVLLGAVVAVVVSAARRRDR